MRAETLHSCARCRRRRAQRMSLFCVVCDSADLDYPECPICRKTTFIDDLTVLHPKAVLRCTDSSCGGTLLASDDVWIARAREAVGILRASPPNLS